MRQAVRHFERHDADYYGTDAEAPTLASGPKLGLGQDVELDRVIVDKNARIGDGVRLVNAAGVQDADGDGYYIRKRDRPL